MSDFSIPFLYVVPAAQSALPTTGSTDALTPGQLGFFRNDYSIANAGNVAAAPYFYVAQGRRADIGKIMGSKRSDKIKGGTGGNVIEFYKSIGSPTAANQITEISGFSVKCGEKVTLTLRAHSSYIETAFYNGYTKSVSVNAPCCDCGEDPCTEVDVPALIDSIIEELNKKMPGQNADNVSLSTFFTFQRIGYDSNAKLVIIGKPLTKYGQPCDVAAFPFEYDRMWFKAFFYKAPATSADFIVPDACEQVATVTTVQDSFYPLNTSEEIKQMEINHHSYEVSQFKHLFRMDGYNPTFNSLVADGQSYSLYYVKFSELDRDAYNWGDYIPLTSSIIIAVVAGSAMDTAVSAFLTAALGTIPTYSSPKTTSTTTTVAPPTTTTTTTI